MPSETLYTFGTLMFLVHGNEFRSAKIKSIIIDERGQNYLFEIDGHRVERSGTEIDKTKEGLFNKMVDRFTARKSK